MTADYTSRHLTAAEKVQLTLAKVQILALKANEYIWFAHTDEDTRKELEESLSEIRIMLSRGSVEEFK